jgi:hypothetical protein
MAGLTWQLVCTASSATISCSSWLSSTPGGGSEHAQLHVAFADRTAFTLVHASLPYAPSPAGACWVWRVRVDRHGRAISWIGQFTGISDGGGAAFVWASYSLPGVPPFPAAVAGFCAVSGILSLRFFTNFGERRVGHPIIEFLFLTGTAGAASGSFDRRYFSACARVLVGSFLRSRLICGWCRPDGIGVLTWGAR